MADDPTPHPLSFPMQLGFREDGTAWVRPTGSPAERELLRQHMLNAIERERASPRPPTVVYGMADAMPDGASVVVVRDPSSSPPATIILDSAAADDRGYCMGRAILRRDEREIPELEGRRVLALLPNGLVRLTVDGRHRWRRDQTVVLDVATHAVERFRELSKQSHPIDVPDVGRVRMCVLPTE